MGQNLSDAGMLVMTPDAWCYDKHALSHVAKFADDTTGPVVEDDGTVRQGRIGFIPRIPEEQFDTPWWACYGHSLRECIDNLCESGWLRSVGDDGAYELNVNRLVRMIDIEETSMPKTSTSSLRNTTKRATARPAERVVRGPALRTVRGLCRSAHAGRLWGSALRRRLRPRRAQHRRDRVPRSRQRLGGDEPGSLDPRHPRLERPHDRGRVPPPRAVGGGRFRSLARTRLFALAARDALAEVAQAARDVGIPVDEPHELQALRRSDEGVRVSCRVRRAEQAGEEIDGLRGGG